MVRISLVTSQSRWHDQPDVLRPETKQWWTITLVADYHGQMQYDGQRYNTKDKYSTMVSDTVEDTMMDYCGQLQYDGGRYNGN